MAAALAVVGLGQVGELEEEGEGARKLVGRVAGERLDAGEGVLKMLLGQRGEGVSGVGNVMRCGIGIAAGDGGAAQVFDGLVEGLARLLAQGFAQQRAYLASGMTHAEILRDFPYLTEENIRACLAFAADRERKSETLAA